MLPPVRDDLARAIKKLKALGGGFAVLMIGGKRMVQCVPGELSMDHTTVIQKAEVGVAGGGEMGKLGKRGTRGSGSDGSEW